MKSSPPVVSSASIYASSAGSAATESSASAAETFTASEPSASAAEAFTASTAASAEPAARSGDLGFSGQLVHLLHRQRNIGPGQFFDFSEFFGIFLFQLFLYIGPLFGRFLIHLHLHRRPIAAVLSAIPPSVFLRKEQTSGQ